eukprot:COSAG02_NODE_28391_length_590_cov_1.234216_1_plen_30_part_10
MHREATPLVRKRTPSETRPTRARARATDDT